MSEEQRKWTSAIFEGTEKMAALIDAMKQLQDLESGHFRPHKCPVGLSHLVRDAIAGLNTVYGEQVRICCDDGLTVECVEVDANLMLGVFQNLIKNGIEHVTGLPDKAERAVRVRLYNQNGHAVAEVNNGGAPVAPERLATFFEKFNTDKGGNGGTGLGTTYAYLVTKAHGGRIAVASSQADGTTVTVKIPQGKAGK